MTRQNLALLLLFGCGWICFGVWSAGYRSGYEEGHDRAWSEARAAYSGRSRVDEASEPTETVSGPTSSAEYLDRSAASLRPLPK